MTGGERHQEDEKQLTMEICEQLNNIINASPESHVSALTTGGRKGYEAGADQRYKASAFETKEQRQLGVPVENRDAKNKVQEVMNFLDKEDDQISNYSKSTYKSK